MYISLNWHITHLSTDIQVAYENSGDKKCPPFINNWLKGDRQPALSFIESTLQKLKARDGFHQAQFQDSTLKTTLVAFRQAIDAAEQGKGGGGGEPCGT